MNISPIISRSAIAADTKTNLYNTWKNQIDSHVPGFSSATQSAPVSWNPTTDDKLVFKMYPTSETTSFAVNGVIQYNGSNVGIAFKIADIYSNTNDSKCYFGTEASFISKINTDWGYVIYPEQLSSLNAGGFFYANSTTLGFKILRVAHSTSQYDGYDGGLWNEESMAFVSDGPFCQQPTTNTITTSDGGKVTAVYPKFTATTYALNTYAPLSGAIDPVGGVNTGLYGEGKYGYFFIRNTGNRYLWVFDTIPVQ